MEKKTLILFFTFKQAYKYVFTEWEESQQSQKVFFIPRDKKRGEFKLSVISQKHWSFVIQMPGNWDRRDKTKYLRIFY